MKLKKAIVIAAIAVIGIIGISGSVVVTQQNEYNVIRQFGRVMDIRTEPGISFKIPLIQTSDTFPNTLLYMICRYPTSSPRTKRPW